MIIVLFHFSNHIFGQRIDFKKDSLFINSFYVNGRTSKSTLDSLLNDKGKEKSITGKQRPGTQAAISWIRITYSRLGLIFTKNDYEPNDLAVAVKLHKNTNTGVDWNNMPTKIFSGGLYIEDNYMNNKRTIDQLQTMQNCKISYQESSFAGHTGIIQCNIVCLDSDIRALFDFQTNELTCIFIGYSKSY
ncbi:MAG TPA: hypothetical protein VFV31_01875 [Chitinophagaceae bacterium]|nr:hypothetical protein [Chitinophagaceae bacterium]